MGNLSSPTPDATTSVKGKVQLTTALGGTAAAPIINADYVAASMMKLGMVRNRQGGTTGAGAWNTVGTSNTATDATDVFWQCGSAASSSAGTVTVTFPTAFAQIPLVVLTSLAAGGFSMAQIETISASNFTFASYSAAGAKNNAIPTYWVAVGQ